MNEIIEQIISLPKSLYVCLRLMPFKYAIKVPILIRYNVKCLSLKGRAKVAFNRFAGVKIGFGHVGAFDKCYERSILQIDGDIQFNNNGGGIFFGHGSRIIVSSKGKLDVGYGFSNTAMLTVVCTDRISIDANVTVSWNTLIMDTDFHPTRDTITNYVRPFTSPIIIGSGCWLCTRSVVLKGSIIPNGCIVGANAVVNKKFTEENSLVAGNPARVVRNNITIQK